MTVAYADDVVILISGIYPTVMVGLVQTALDQIVRWSSLNGLRTNSVKTELIMHYYSPHNIRISDATYWK